MNKPWYLCMNGVLKWAVVLGGLIFAFGGNWAKLEAIQRTVNLSATQKSVDDLRKAMTDRVERLEGFHFQPAP